MNLTTLFVGLAALIQTPAAPQPASPKVEVVAVTGCLKQEGTTNNWTLINATDPVASRATMPPPDQVPKEPAVGKNQFKLIGVSEFNLSDKKDKTVLVKGLFVKATPVSRLNITSVTTLSASCPSAKNPGR